MRIEKGETAMRPIMIQTALFLSLVPAIASGNPPADKLDFFERKVRPILVENCYSCHSADTKPAGGLRVDDRNGLVAGGNTGPAIVPGDPDKGNLLKRVVHGDGKRRMPPEGDGLGSEKVEILRQWIRDGAVWPPVNLPASLGKARAEYEQLRKTHWAWQPLTKPSAPAVANRDWPRDDVDRFILARLESNGLRPVADADRLSLARRLSFDLTGLPPSPGALDAYLADKSPEATARFVDSLLASPAFGEHWGRHWLDVARYGESTGPSRNIPYPHAWRYRDYVIDSFNRDVPFDRFIREQVAGDLLPAASVEEGNRQKVATGFLALGVKDVNQRFKVRFIMDNVDEQVDVVTRSVLGLTVSCARCHDHKFDPVPQSDYYAIAGIFTSTENASGLRNMMGGGGLAYYVPDNLLRLGGSVPEAPAEKVRELTEKVAEARKAWDAIRGTAEGLKRGPNGLPAQRELRVRFEKAQSELLALTDPAQRGLAAHGARDLKTVADTEIRVRGEAEKLGPVVPRGFLTAFKVPDAKPVNKAQSGRLELADWLVSGNNPLSPRVYANRVWAKLFGRGIVSTIDNFGVNGDAPSHPELLDHVASRLVDGGWSTKKLIRALVLTRAYQLGTESDPANRKVDPANILSWRHSPRRLTSDEFRDAVLASAGGLSKQRPAGTVAKDMRMIEMRDNGPEARSIHDSADKSHARSVYLPLLRGVTPKALEAFDPVEQTLVTGQRDSTTVPGQSLFLLNSGFIRRQSLALAERLLKSEGSDSDRIAHAWNLILGRKPGSHETERALAFLASYESDSREELVALANAAAAKPVNPAKPAGTEAKKDEPPADPDQIDQTGEAQAEEAVRGKDARSDAWLALVQAVYATAEFRFVK